MDALSESRPRDPGNPAVSLALGKACGVGLYRVVDWEVGAYCEDAETFPDLIALAIRHAQDRHYWWPVEIPQVRPVGMLLSVTDKLEAVGSGTG